MQPFRRISNRIDADRNQLYLRIVLTQLLLDLAERRRQWRTDGCASSKNEIDRDRLSLDEIAVEVKLLAILVKNDDVGNRRRQRRRMAFVSGRCGTTLGLGRLNFTWHYSETHAALGTFAGLGRGNVRVHRAGITPDLACLSPLLALGMYDARPDDGSW